MDTSKYPCLGALIGDTVGSVYEFDNIKTTNLKDGQMHVLLIQRGNEPYKGYWAFPGGFLDALPELAFDHDKILEDAKRVLGING